MDPPPLQKEGGQEHWSSARRATVRTACPRDDRPNGGNGDDNGDVGQQQPQPQHGDSASSSSRRRPPPPPSIRRRKRRRHYWIGASAAVALIVVIIILPVLYVDFATLDRVFLPSEVVSNKKRMNSQTTTTTMTMTLPEPVAVLHQYVQWHSHDSLLRQPWNRTFAIAYYSCPHRVGNYLHSFFNAAIWAVIYNRTLLWKFDGPTQQEEEDCNSGVLQRAPWMPSYDAWAARLALPEPKAVKMNTRRTPKQNFFTREEQWESLSPTRNPVAIFPQIPDVARSNHNISRVSWWEDPRRLTRPTVIRNTAAHFGRTIHGMDNPWVSRRTLQSLYAEGLYFLYGMLFREMFEIRNVPPPLPQSSSTPALSQEEQEGEEVSIALHSRHAVLADDGSNVDGEIQCLEQILRANPNNNNNNNNNKAQNESLSSSFAVYLMSDRPATVAGVREWLLEKPHHGHRCRVVTVPHNNVSQNTAGTGTKEEHGPFAGAGFLWDLAVASRARTAVVGDFSRSSTALLLDLIVYDRKMERWRKKMTKTTAAAAAAAAAAAGGRATIITEEDDTTKDLRLCKLPDRPES